MENQERHAWELRKPSFASLLATGDPPWLPGLERWGVKGSAEIAVSISHGYGLRDIVFYFFLLSFIICLCILFLTFFPCEEEWEQRTKSSLSCDQGAGEY